MGSGPSSHAIIKVNPGPILSSYKKGPNFITFPPLPWYLTVLPHFSLISNRRNPSRAPILTHFATTPKQIHEINDFLLTARRKDARWVKIKRSRYVVKFKVRCSKYLNTLCVFDSEKADKLKQSLPPEQIKELKCCICDKGLVNTSDPFEEEAGKTEDLIRGLNQRVVEAVNGGVNGNGVVAREGKVVKGLNVQWPVVAAGSTVVAAAVVICVFHGKRR
ncbi:hypothetical protein PIB30_061502 [Stylosanthes scabra]|uniref:Uncharacterized protein n=1 Tax=Stylosanthes scabra TaxID=79078 RepID=A0ABU6SL04_9FABA|nr:hypothetical protein [Stylosanthes scabra]